MPNLNFFSYPYFYWYWSPLYLRLHLHLHLHLPFFRIYNKTKNPTLSLFRLPPEKASMGLHLIALLKLKLLSSSSHTCTPLVANLIWPFLIKLSYSFRFVHGAYADLIHASRLFFFQLRQITFDSHQEDPANATRLERAVRLVHRRLRRSSRSQIVDDDSLHTLSMLALWYMIFIYLLYIYLCPQKVFWIPGFCSFGYVISCICS